MTSPISHQRDAEKLEADGVPKLFELHLNPSGVIYLFNGQEVTWQGHTYESLGCELSPIKRTADEMTPRPTFRFQNPFAMFSAAIANGALNKATLIRRKVLRKDLEANVNISDIQQWIVMRVTELTRTHCTVELRAPSDGHNFVSPARMFIPPEFPFVTL